MATYPPPYPPAAGPPFGFNPRQQRRLIRDQAKAQRAAFKAQRDLYRSQLRGMKRTSILGPLIIVAVGIVLLLLRLEALSFSSFAAWYGRWWPLLFVAAGLVLMLEWAFDQRSRPGEPPYVRRGVGGGVVLLLLVLAASGTIVHGMSRDSEIWLHGLSINPDNLAEFIGEKHEREQTLDQPFPRGASLSIDNPHGDITLTGKSDDNKIHITVYKQIYSQSDSEADQKAAELSPHIDSSNGRLSLTLPARAGASTDLTITVPDFAQASIDSGRGDIHVSSLKAPLSVTSNHGDVELTDIHGDITAHVNHNDSSFSAHQVTGGVVLKGSADDLNLSNISGAVSLEGEFYGDTHLEHVGGATSFRTSRTTFSFARLDGNVDISPEAELTGDRIVGPTLLSTRSRNINLQRFIGDLNITNSNGAVDLTSLPPLGDLTVHNRKGSVNLTLPADAGFAVQADTTGGEISDDFGFTPFGIKDKNSVSAKVGSGQARISISTTHGDVALRKAERPPVADPAPPAPPAAPATSVPSLPRRQKKVVLPAPLPLTRSAGPASTQLKPS